jgi:hypothetical protein
MYNKIEYIVHVVGDGRPKGACRPDGLKSQAPGRLWGQAAWSSTPAGAWPDPQAPTWGLAVHFLADILENHEQQTPGEIRTIRGTGSRV